MIKQMFWVAMLLLLCVATSYGQYNGECWVVSGGETVYKLYADGNADPQVIPNLPQASAAEVNPADGVVWIAVSAANTVYRYNPNTGDFLAIPDINRPNMIAINPADGSAWIAGYDGVKKVSGDGTTVIATIAAHEPAVAVNPKDGSAWITNARGPIARYDAAGNKIADAPTMGEPKSVTVDYEGNAWIADSQHSVLMRVSPSGQKLVEITDIPNPTSPRINPMDGSVWVVSQQSMLINLGADGTKKTEFLAGMAIVAISVSPSDGGIWIADLLGETFQGEISKWTSGGQPLFKNPIPQPSSVSVGYWSGN
jgi:ligand-binding sensor domain-containing protein